jgi:hypothetical protein
MGRCWHVVCESLVALVCVYCESGALGRSPFNSVTWDVRVVYDRLDDMEEPDSSWLWSFGTWVNGGGWATCEARMMLAYMATGRPSYALDRQVQVPCPHRPHAHWEVV